MYAPRRFFGIRVSLVVLFILSSVLPIRTPFSPDTAIAAPQPAPVIEPQQTIEKEPAAGPSFAPGSSLLASTRLAPPQSLSQSPPRQATDSSPYVPDYTLPHGTADVALYKEVSAAQLNGLPLRVEANGLEPDQQLEIQAAALEPALAQQLSPFGVAFRLSVKSPGQNDVSQESVSAASVAEPLFLTLDYGGIPMPFGGSVADRLTLYRLSGCEVQEGGMVCAQGAPLPGDNDRVQQQLHVPLNDAAAAMVDPEDTLSDQSLDEHTTLDEHFDSAEEQGDAAGQQIFLPMVSTDTTAVDGDEFYVLASSTGGSQGSYEATPFSHVMDYQVGLFTGAAQAGYPIPVPPAAAGAAPSIALTYNSSSVDGMNTSKNVQPSGVGIGWELEQGYITHHLKTCGTSSAPEDKCATEVYSISLNGKTSWLVEKESNSYRLHDDPLWQVKRKSSSNSNHPDFFGHYWEVTTPDGTLYRFGGEFDPESGQNQQSVFWTPIYDSYPCTAANDMCEQAWRWNLDRIEDTNGNVTAYYYQREHNYYGARGRVEVSYREGSRYSPVTRYYREQYIRGGWLDKIEYGRIAGQNTTPSTRVLFHEEERCEGSCNWPADYPDTPGDLVCTDSGKCYEHAPSFWTRKRLDHVETQVYDQGVSAWESVARFDLTQSFPTPPDSLSERKLTLDGITQHTGDGSAALPGVDYDYTMLENRHNPPSGVPVMNMPRLNKITTELGGEVTFAYGQSHPCLVTSIPAPSEAALPYDCFPDADPYTGSGGWVLWEKWKVMQMDLSDTFSGNAAQTTTYSYSTPGWAYYDNPTGSRHRNDFRGHEIVTVTDASGAVSEVRFHRGMHGDRNTSHYGGIAHADITLSDGSTRQDTRWLAGQIAEERQLDASGNALTRIVNFYKVNRTAGIPPASRTVSNPGNVNDSAYRALLSKSESTVYGTTPKQTRTEYEYDAYSNVTRELVHGDLSTTDDDRTIETAYVYNTTDYIVNRAKWEKLWAGIERSGGVCSTVMSSNVPKTIYSSGTPTVISNLSFSADPAVTGDGLVTDINVVDLKGVHQWYAQSLDFKITSPDATTVQILKSRWCSSASSGFDLDLDDEATSNGVPCPPYSGTLHKPYRPLSAFDGRPSSGTWRLTVHDTRDEDGGSLNSWGLRICAARAQTLVEGNELSLSAYAYDGGVIGDAPTKGNPTLVRAYSQVSPSTAYAESSMAYDSRGRVTSATDANSHTTSTTYHPFYGYAQSVTNALNHTVTTEVDPGVGVATKITDANNKVVELDYDDFGRLTDVWLPTEPTSRPASFQFVYDPAARPAYAQSRQLMDASTGSYLEGWSYVDGFGRTIQRQQASATAGERILSSQQHDNRGLLRHSSAAYAVSGAAGSGYVPPDWNSLTTVHRLSYDALGRSILNELMSSGSVLWSSNVAYDGWATTGTDANGHSTEQVVDAFGSFIQVNEENDEGSGPVTYTTGYDYDLAGNLTQVADHAGNVSSMAYDLLGRKTDMTDPDMGAWSYQYDDVGNLIAQQDGRGLWMHLGYDALNRLVSKRKDSANGNLLAEYVYDMLVNGQLYASKAYDGNGNLQVEKRVTALDDRYRATETQSIVAGQGTFRMGTAYNAADQVTSLTYPGDNAGGLGEIVTNGFNAIWQLSGVQGTGGVDYVASTTYNAQGRVTQLTSGNGLARQYDYAPDTQRLTSIRAGMTTPWSGLQDLSYAYDNVGNVTTLTDGANAGQVQSFGYDWLNRLTSANTTGVGDGQYSRSYAYDAIGNITSFAGNAYTYSTAQPHAVTVAHGNSYGYDANGNQATRTIGGTAYTVEFDYENRLTAIKQGGLTIGEFVYDADGGRIMGTVDGVTTVYIGGVYEYQAGASTSYYAGSGGSVAFRRSGYATDNGLYHLLRDHLGSSSVIVDDVGNVAKAEFYYPFGGNRGSAFSSLATKRFTGQYHEAGLPGGEGLSYYNARWYDAQLGRFASADTIVGNLGNPQAFNRFSYTLNNPLRFSDPSGHWIFEGTPDDQYKAAPSGRRSAVRSTTRRSHAEVTGARLLGYGFLRSNANIRSGGRIRSSTQNSKPGVGERLAPDVYITGWEGGGSVLAALGKGRYTVWDFENLRRVEVRGLGGGLAGPSMSVQKIYGFGYYSSNDPEFSDPDRALEGRAQEETISVGLFSVTYGDNKRYVSDPDSTLRYYKGGFGLSGPMPANFSLTWTESTVIGEPIEYRNSAAMRTDFVESNLWFPNQPILGAFTEHDISVRTVGWLQRFRQEEQ